jgi:penicillin-binding protein
MEQPKQPDPNALPPKRRGYGWIVAGKIAGLTILWLVLFGVLAALTAAGAAAGFVASLVQDEPVRSQKMIEEKISQNAETGFVYFRDGSLVGQLRTEEDRIPITYKEIPQVVIDAVIAIEDKNFFNHIGVDSNGLLRAIKQQLLNESVQTGGSTITQQVARRVFLTLDQTSSRKAREIFLSLRLERYLSKQEILTAYLNKIPYGNSSSGYQIFGIKAAAKGIFGLDNLNDINIAQAAYLAGVPQLPSLYSAFNSRGEFREANFKRAIERQKLVLRRMLEENKITQAQYEEALAFDIYSSLAKPTEKAYNTYPYLMLEVERQASQILALQQNPNLTREDLDKKEYAGLVEDARQQLLRGGYKIKTTIDKDIYGIMRSIAENPDNFSPDSKTKGVEQTAAVMIDHKTGAILGMIEGRDFHLEQMNFATQMTRQPGSAMKPIAAYLPAIDMGLIQPASILDDAPIILDNGTRSKHIPKNVNNKYAGLMTARRALNDSNNLPALKIFLDMVTIPEAWKFAKSVGITTITEDDYHSQTGVIGGLKYGVTVEELTGAYGAIANKGVFNDTYLIEEITTSDNKVVYKHQPNPTRVVSEQSAYLMTDMLRTVITDGSGTMVKSKFKHFGKIPIAGKTGTTQNYGDVWFQGFTPDITLGVWVGYEKQIHELSKDGRNRAKLIWAEIMNQVADAKPEYFPTKTFERPEGIVSMTVSSVSGKLPTALTKEAGKLVTDLFNRKFIPTEADDALVAMKYITYNGVNYLPQPETPEDMLREAIMIKRQKPIDVLMDEIQEALKFVPAQSRRALSFYLPADAANSAPGRTDPRVEDGSAPPAPGNVMAEMVNKEAHISFSPVAKEDVVGYRLYRSADGVNFEKWGPSILTGEPTRFVDTAAEGRAYSYYVTAVDVGGHESPKSAIVTTDGLPPIDPNGNTGVSDLPGGGDDVIIGEPQTYPTQPTGLSASASAISVTLTWDANPSNQAVTSYNVWFAPTGSSNYTLLGSTPTNRFEHLSPLSAGLYRITAVNALGESLPSAAVQTGEAQP